MIFRRPTLDGIAAGHVTLAFRRWRRPQARPGSTLRTAIGVLAFDSVDQVSPADITEEEARRAGHPSVAQLLDVLNKKGTDAPIYRVTIRLAGADPRVALREDSALSDEDVADLRRRLDRLDRASQHGPWTRAVLRLIVQRPAVRAPDLAASMGRETAPFKIDVRKLKELGLTESLEVGYRISPRGQALLDRLDGE